MRYFIVDVFAEELFQGNQASVCLLEKPFNDVFMQHIDAENNLAEIAFVIKNSDAFDLRWFTSEVEIDLCGHATLESAYILSQCVNTTMKTFSFNTLGVIIN